MMNFRTPSRRRSFFEATTLGLNRRRGRDVGLAVEQPPSFGIIPSGLLAFVTQVVGVRSR